MVVVVVSVIIVIISKLLMIGCVHVSFRVLVKEYKSDIFVAVR